MEASNERINLALLLWNNDHRHRSRTAEDYFPHEVRSLVERQKIIEVTISLLLAVVYILIMAGSGLSFFFFHEVQTIRSSTGWFFLRCNLDTTYQCYVVYASQTATALGATFLLIGSLVKSCCCMW